MLVEKIAGPIVLCFISRDVDLELVRSTFIWVRGSGSVFRMRILLEIKKCFEFFFDFFSWIRIRIDQIWWIRIRIRSTRILF